MNHDPLETNRKTRIKSKIQKAHKRLNAIMAEETSLRRNNRRSGHADTRENAIRAINEYIAKLESLLQS
jgi:flagellar biosynthesis chaperone FliJ